MRYGMIPIASGLLLLSVSELAGFASIRFVAAVLLVAGAVGVGIAASRKPRLVRTLPRIAGIFSRTAFCVAAAVLVAPVVAVLIGSLAGAVTQLFSSSSVTDILPAISAGVVGLLLLTVTVTALIVAIGAICNKALPQTEDREA